MEISRQAKRIVACFILLVLMCSTVLAEGTASTIQFDRDGQLKILIIADPQDTENPQKAMLDLINASLEKAQPDLVIFLGDMIHGPSINGIENVQKAIDAIVSPIVERGIPFALVFGNHDEECGISNEEQLKIYQSYPGCLAVEGEEMPGCGNYYLLIENPIHQESPVILWFLDSGNHAEPGKGTYDFVKKEQNEWMLQAHAELKEKYAAPVSFAFQHIPVPQVYEMIKEVPFGTSGSVTCYGPNLFKWYIADDQYITEGKLGEGPCSSEYDSGEFDAWKQMHLKAAFFGHDHLNDYFGTFERIDLVATSGTGFYMYGRGDEHGTRLITIDAEKPDEYQTRMLYYKDIVSEPLPGFMISSIGVMFQQYLLIGLAVLIILILLIVMMIRRIRKVKRSQRDSK